MNTKTRKLIFFDIDGTIITEGNRHEDRFIPPSLPETLKKLKENGHLCFINSGRAYAEIEDTIRNLDFDGYICGCGTFILYHGKTLFSKSFPYDFGYTLIKDLDEMNLEWLLEGVSDIYYSTKKYTTIIDGFRSEQLRLVPDAITLIEPGTTHDLNFDKFCVGLGKDHKFEEFQKKYQSDLTFIDRGQDFFEIMPKTCSKASGIRFLEDYFDIPHEDTIAIGDSVNDLPMLSYAAYSICMGNGAKELFDQVNYVTDSVENDGICHAMEYLHLI